ncbi:hypothetical protein CHS0354_035391 [Potamilus streckersoni]|uniref:Uncharacterized protein n=1 Tax=Potamilus streckersoni TaxID=2493646 RepID=A0AAE0TDK7_9BIVA|nr:hypothetical protein CHS0354_035391 [Potamilus streckersoni]
MQLKENNQPLEAWQVYHSNCNFREREATLKSYQKQSFSQRTAVTSASSVTKFGRGPSQFILYCIEFYTSIKEDFWLLRVS